MDYWVAKHLIVQGGSPATRAYTRAVELGAGEYVTSIVQFAIARCGTTAVESTAALEGSNDLNQWVTNLATTATTDWPAVTEKTDPNGVSISGPWQFVRLAFSVLSTSADTAVLSGIVRTTQAR